MKALVYHGPGQRSWDEVPDPTIIEPTDVIVRISSSTICGTDLHILKGDVPEVQPGTILGHEAVGTIIEKGDAVRSVAVGDRVLVSCITSCGTCPSCREGRYGLCSGGGGWIFGHLINGLQAEFARVPFADTSVYKVPEQLNDGGRTLYDFGKKSRGHRAALVVGLAAAVLGLVPQVGSASDNKTSLSLPRTLSVHIVYQPQTAHIWTVNGAKRSAVKLRAGGALIIVNDDLRPHRLMIGGGSKVVIAGSPTMNYVGSRTKLIFPKPGVYQLTTVFGPPYIDDIKVVGAPSTLRLTLTVN
ncbi:MAG: alcohol dehydrogenase catalytic domain-containing protein [Actinobacteria bacterium]|uniref:Unannotated protein n=1 Tax=freshwater metagenome TaxID=449393 RepID=A0A6J6Q2I2_9ZZZZ|nr:alcohol dehydrogenase catalytic domain-containing protein [Actinomycetota bacterium]